MRGVVARTPSLVLAAIAMLLVLAPVTAVGQAGIVVTFSKPVYDRGDVVAMKVSGLQPPATVAVEVYSPDGRLVWIYEEDNIPFTEAVFTFKLPDNSPDGIYTAYVAVKGYEPVKATFTVHRPEFRIVSATPTPKTPVRGETVTVTVTVVNVGAEGSFYLYLLDPHNNIVAKVGPIALKYNERGTYQLSFKAPTEAAGAYNYTVTVYNIKYGVIDSKYNVTIYVHYPPPPPPYTPTPTPTATPTPTVTPPPPPPLPPLPPPPTTTTPATVTKSATSTTPPPNAVQAFVADIAGMIGANGVAVTSFTVVAPPVHVAVTVPAETLFIGPSGVPVRPQKLVITVLRQAPPVEPPNKLVGPAVDIRFEGFGSIGFNQSVVVTVPYDPAKVPPGYSVRLAYYDVELGKWVPLPTINVDPIRGVVAGVTRHFTIFAAVAYRVVTAVTTTATVTTTVTVPATTTTTTTVTKTVTATPITTTVTSTTTTTVTKTKTAVTTVPVTVTSPTTVTKTVEKTVTSIKTTTVEKTVTASPATVTSTVTTTRTVAVTPAWAYVALAIAIIAVIAAILLAIRAGRRGG